MTITSIQKVSVSLPSAVVTSPEYERIPVPMFEGANMVMIVRNWSSAKYKFGDAYVTIEVDSGGHTDGFGIIDETPVGVPYGASHVVFVSWGAAVNFEVIFGAER